MLKHIPNAFYSPTFKAKENTPAIDAGEPYEDNYARAVMISTEVTPNFPSLTEQRLIQMIKEAVAHAPVDNGHEYAEHLAHYIVTNNPEFKRNPAFGHIPESTLNWYGGENND